MAHRLSSYPPTSGTNRKKLTRVSGSITISSSKLSACRSFTRIKIRLVSNASSATPNCFRQSS
jgi:hypothetical protein